MFPPYVPPSLPLSPPQTPNGARVCSFLLPALLTITQAPVGLIASVLHRKDGTPYIKVGGEGGGGGGDRGQGTGGGNWKKGDTGRDESREKNG